jgi:cobalt-zinc-cadmium efflux system membrane fusion protein
MSMRFSAFVAVLFSVFIAAAPASMAHEGHDHEAAPVAAASSSALRTEAVSAAFELVAVRQGGELRIWLDRFETNKPVTGASIEVETPAGPAKAVAAPDGTYTLPAPWALTPGRYELIFTVTDGADVDLLTSALEVPSQAATVPAAAAARPMAALFEPTSIAAAGVFGILLGALSATALRRRPMVWAPVLGLLMLAAFGAARLFAHEGHDHGDQTVAAPTAGDRAQVLSDGSVFLPKPTQRVLAVRTAPGRESSFAKRSELPGRIVADPNSSGLVQAAAAGRLSPPEAGFPRLGARVKAGDILAYVSTPFLAIDQSTMRQQQGDLDQQLSIAERRLTRYETLQKSGAVSQVTLDETRLELQGLRDRRAALDRSKREPEALRAPVDGVIAASNAVAGQIADPSAVVFQIVDPKRLFVEALSFEAPQDTPSASARTSDGRSLPLSFVGAGLADRNQSLPVQYAIEGGTEGLRIGQFVTVFAQTSEAFTGLAAPRASVVRRGNGESVVYTHSTAERFEARVVRTQPLDADRVLIVAGLDAVARLVTQAAELLNQVR